MIKFTEEKDKLGCIFSGQLDTRACMDIEGPLKEAIKERISLVVFDLNDVDYVCSRFLRICVQTAKTMQSGEFLITNVQPPIKKILKISGLDNIFNIQ